MLLLIYYLVLVAVGDLSAYGIGLVIERTWGPNASLAVFLTLYFVTLWVSWIIAVRLTAPKSLPTHA